jgi:dUTP pyrophosphatase
MQKVKVLVQKLDHFKGELPRYETLFASGMDVKAQLEKSIRLQPGERILVPTGLAMAIPAGFEIQVRPRSGWAAKKGISVPNTPGTIDADYRGEVKVALINLGQEMVEIQDQDRIAQLVLAPVLQVEWEETNSLPSTERGAGGFGSTGFKS